MTAHRWIVAAILLAFLATLVSVARSLSVTCDEPCDIGRGFSYWAHGEAFVGPEHPPLTRIVSGAALGPLGVRDEAAGRIYASARAKGKAGAMPALLPYGGALVFADNQTFRVAGALPGPDSVVFAARLSVLVWPILLVLVVYAWARARFGNAGGLVALALAVTYPDILGNGAYVTTDVPLAATGLLAGFALERLIARGGWAWLVTLGLALGAALLTKFSGLFFGPGLVLAAAGALARPIDPAEASAAHPFGAAGGRRLVAVALAVLVILGLALVLGALVYRSLSPVQDYMSGVAVLRGVHNGRRAPYLFGEDSAHPALYFLVATALRAPLATIALVLASFAVLARARGRLAEELALLAPGAVFFAAMSLAAPPLGTRYVLPAIGFFLVSAGRLGPWAGHSRLRWSAIALALAANVVGCAHDHPFHATSSNLLVGREPFRALDDSNVDWGGGAKAVATWQREHGVSSVAVVPFCRLPYELDPKGGVVLRNSPFTADRFGVKGELAGPDAVFWPRRGKVYVVSEHVLARAIAFEHECAGRDVQGPFGRGPLHRVLGATITPVAEVGGNAIFDLRGAP